MERIDIKENGFDLRTLKVGDVIIYEPEKENIEEFNGLTQEEKDKLGTITEIITKNGITTCYNFLEEGLASYIDELYIP